MKKRLSLALQQDLKKNLLKVKSDSLIIGVNEGNALNPISSKIDQATNGVIKKLAKRKEFEGKVGQQAYVAAPEGLSAERLYLIGFGKSKDLLSNEDIDKILNSTISSLKSSKSNNASICFPSLKYSNKSQNDSWLLQKMATFFENRVYTYDAKLNKKNKSVNHLKKINVFLESSLSATNQRKALKTGQVIGQGMNAAKDLANLPGNICVEVPCLINTGGIQPVKVGSLPPHLAALMMTNINVQQLTVEAALSGKKEHVYHAAMLDPHTAAELSLDEIWNLVDDLLEAHAGMIPKLF